MLNLSNFAYKMPAFWFSTFISIHLGLQTQFQSIHGRKIKGKRIATVLPINGLDVSYQSKCTVRVHLVHTANGLV